MRIFLQLLFVGSFLVAFLSAQTVQTALSDVGQIRMLESTRDEVRKILVNYETEYDDSRHFQIFSNSQVTIRVEYASGECPADSYDDEYENLWRVKPWTVVRVEVTIEDSLPADLLPFKLSTFKKQQRFEHDSESFIYHNKAKGIALEASDEQIHTVMFFASTRNKGKLCGNDETSLKFYSTESYFPNSKFQVICGYVNGIAHVTDLTLSSYEVSATTSKSISVSANATGPENDPLSVNYYVSGGRIVGRGLKVVWNLTGASAGTYTITVGVDDGSGMLGKTITRSVVVK